MTYPPSPYRGNDPVAALRLMDAHPFAHFFSSHVGLRATRLPFVTDRQDGRPVRLRSHLHARNPQAEDLDGASVLVVFSGPATYVSPHWRAVKHRGGTYDYEEVRVWGTARVVDDIEYFRRLVDDLSALIEPQYAEVGDYPVWQSTMAPEGYLEEQFPGLVSFLVEVEDVESTSKLHQDFSVEDRRAVAEHLSRCRRDDARAIAERIRARLGE